MVQWLAYWIDDLGIEIRPSTCKKDFVSLQSIQTEFRVYQTSYTMGPKGHFPEGYNKNGGHIVKLRTDLHLESMIRMYGAINPVFLIAL